jgi:hypothetical protein
MAKKAFLSRLLDSVIDARTRQAARYVDQYLKDHEFERSRKG